MMIRRPEAAEHGAIHQLVQLVVNETYQRLWSALPIEVEPEDYSRAWIALVGTRIAGVLLTTNDRLDDLWVLQEYRGHRIGSKLLSWAESEIAARRYGVMKWRVVQANEAAVAFYIHHGWHIAREFKHEKFAVQMLELNKRAI